MLFCTVAFFFFLPILSQRSHVCHRWAWVHLGARWLWLDWTLEKLLAASYRSQPHNPPYGNITTQTQYRLFHTEKFKNASFTCKNYINFAGEINYCLIVTVFTFYLFFPFTYHYSQNNIQYLNPGIMSNFFVFQH